MGKIRLCTNAECIECQKKNAYKKDDDTFCVKCGSELVYMCKNCKEVELSESDGDYCPECQVLQDEKREKMFATLKKVGAGIAASGTVIATIIKIVSDVRKGRKKAKKVLDKIDPDRAKLEKVKAKAKKMVKKAEKKFDK